MTENLSANDGRLTVKHRGVYLHSKYQPQQEATRYARSLDKLQEASIVVILGPGLGYLFDAVRKLNQNANIVAIFYSSHCYEWRVADADSAWHPDSEHSLSQFLSETISEWHVDGLQVVQWEPSTRAFPDQANYVGQEVSARVRQATGSLLTTAAFGKLWLYNSITNFLRIRQFVSLAFPKKAIIIAASGPSLESAIPSILNARDHCTLWALPSSIMALSESGLHPDLVIQTDAGFYARHHLYSMNENYEPLMAMPLTATRPPGSLASSTAVINQGSFIEAPLLSAIGYPALKVPWNGTVAGTALELAKHFCVPVLFAGLDLCAADIMSHVRPHPFDILHRTESDRLNPELTVRVVRMYDSSPLVISERIRTSQALKTYASWFESSLTRGENQVFRINPSEVPVQGMLDITADALGSVLGINTGSQTTVAEMESVEPDTQQKVMIVKRCIKQWKQQLKSISANTAADVTGSVNELLYFLGAKDIPMLRKAAAAHDHSLHRKIVLEMTQSADAILTDMERVASAH